MPPIQNKKFYNKINLKKIILWHFLFNICCLVTYDAPIPCQLVVVALEMNINLFSIEIICCFQKSNVTEKYNIFPVFAFQCHRVKIVNRPWIVHLDYSEFLEIIKCTVLLKMTIS